MEEAERCSLHNQRQPCAICRANQKIGPNRKKMLVSAIAAIGKNRELGKNNELLWQIPDDLKRFKELSLGKPIILGRKTFESIVAILGKPLPGRTSIVVTRDPNWNYESVITVASVEAALEEARKLNVAEVIVGGGAQIYEQALPFTDRLHLTLIDDSKDADSFFPAFEQEFTKKTFEQEREWGGIKYRWVDVER